MLFCTCRMDNTLRALNAAHVLMESPSTWRHHHVRDDSAGLRLERNANMQHVPKPSRHCNPFGRALAPSADQESLTVLSHFTLEQSHTAAFCWPVGCRYIHHSPHKSTIVAIAVTIYTYDRSAVIPHAQDMRANVMLFGT